MFDTIQRPHNLHTFHNFYNFHNFFSTIIVLGKNLNKLKREKLKLL